ncbi:MAG: hypothetical protein JSR17_10775 [Proteobacteria bacterium]|nr:hypothetical protein [Pseudomonadota bacterium]
MKKALKVTFGTMLAVSMAAPIAALAHEHHHHHHHGHAPYYDHLAVWVDGTYMKPTNNGLSVGDFAQPPFSNVGGLDGARNHMFLEPENEFDYGFGISVRLPHSHTRGFISYDHYQSDKDHQADINVRNLGIAPDVNAPTFETTNYDVNQHELRVGAIHDLHFGDHFCLDVLAFLEYDRLRQNVFETISRDNNANLRNRETENLIKGFGPGVGLVSRWFAHNPHWHVFAGANVVLLKTDNEYSQTFNVINDNIGNNQAGSYYDYEPFDSDSIVTKVDAQFGVNYHCKLKHELHGAQWGITLGMRYMNMINVLKNGNVYEQPTARRGGGAMGVPVDFSPNLGSAQDWGKWGPFIRFQVGGAHS